jgi:hypothetical protein
MAQVDRQEQSNMLEQLLPEIMLKVLECLDIASRVKLACMNRHLRRRVYDECSQAWTKIDFSSTDFALRGRLTDYQLSRLFIRVNAQDVTVDLGLCLCSQIRGSGLVPLRNSHVLERINLLLTPASNDLTSCLDILRSMIPHKLYCVEFSDYSVLATDFTRNLRSVKLIQAQEQGTRCACCHELVMEESRKIVPNVEGYPTFRCCRCEKHFCQRSSCPMDLRECGDCREYFCMDCGDIDDCDQVWQCYDCGISFCFSCRYVSTCICCEKGQCENCDIYDSCSRCAENHCEECSTLEYVCANECDLVCENCRKTDSCSKCNSPRCEGCNDDFRTCHECSKRFCGKSVCLEDTEKCGGCKNSFCKDHNRFVDCGKCEIRHCRACEYVKWCLCGSACFVECFCAEKRPAKRMK